jgi:hypothetical protein
MTSPGAVCVTGMHRSGTSFAARALDVLGVSFGDADALMKPGPDNEAGYWENAEIKELDNDLLAHLGGSWDSPPVLAPGWADDPAIEEFHVRATEVLDRTFGPAGDRPLVAWKDPRLSLLLPFWRRVTRIDATIVVVRNPDEVAASLWKRNSIRPPQACLLWLRYVLAAIANDPDGHLIVDHAAFFDDLEATLLAMADHLSLEPPGALVDQVRSHLDPGLRHHVESNPARERGDENPIVSLAAATWNGGAVTVDTVQPDVRRAIADGWFRPPVDTELLDHARARNVDLTELLRRRSRARTPRRADETLIPGDGGEP